MLELYQFEGCLFCARVRQALDAHGLDYVVRTEPRHQERRKRVKAVSGQTRVPVLVDPAKDRVVIDSSEIIAYLDAEYGAAKD